MGIVLIIINKIIKLIVNAGTYSREFKRFCRVYRMLLLNSPLLKTVGVDINYDIYHSHSQGKKSSVMKIICCILYTLKGQIYLDMLVGVLRCYVVERCKQERLDYGNEMKGEVVKEVESDILENDILKSEKPTLGLKKMYAGFVPPVSV